MRATDRSVIAVTISVMLACFTVTPLTSGLELHRPELGVDHRDWCRQLGTATDQTEQRRSAQRPDRDLALSTRLGLSLTLTSETSELGAPWFAHYPSLWAQGIEHMRTQASPMDPDNGVKLIFVDGDRVDHDHDRPVGIRGRATGLGHRTACHSVSGARHSVWALTRGDQFLLHRRWLSRNPGRGRTERYVAMDPGTHPRLGRGLRNVHAGGLAGRQAISRFRPFWPPSCSGLSCPRCPLPGIGFGNGPGGNGPLQLTDPTLDLRRNLNQPEDREVISTRPRDPAGSTCAWPRFLS